MLLRVGIESVVLSGDDTDYPPPVQAQHEVVLQQLVELGLLVDDGPGALRKSIQAIRHVGLRKRWQKALKSLGARIDRPETGLNSGPLNTDALRLVDLDVALLSAEGAAACDLPRHECSYIPSPDLPEVVRFDSAARSKRVTQLRKLRQSPIEMGTDVDELWRTRFQPYADRYSNVVIVDRYAGQLCTRTGDASGLAQTLWRLRGSRCVAGLKLYVGAENQAHAFKIRDAILDLEGTEGLRELDLTVAPDELFRLHAHGRYFRFSDQVLSVDTGLSVFEGQKVPARCIFTAHRNFGSCRDVERLLRAAQFSLF